MAQWTEQQICKSATITLAVRNFWSRTPSATGFYGRQAEGRRKVADKMQVNFEKFKTHCRSKHSTFRFV